ncbi:radical SAM protein [Candidatus Parcubacteria bacterium]|nr:radical SAM protein [Candidatus Parcubacteria bacterium]
MFFDIDVRFREYLKNLKQVFIYVTDRCNLRCLQCLYKPNLVFSIGKKEIPIETALALLSDFKDMGASKLTIMGGEPTLYGSEDGNKPLKDLIQESKRMGYEYVRIDTNGQFDEKIFQQGTLSGLNEITFILDGYSPGTNDFLRGKGTFQKCVENIKIAREFGFKVDVTCCVHRALTERDECDNLLLDKMILFVESLGVSKINFHDLFKASIPRDLWTNDYTPAFNVWADVYKEIQNNIKRGKYRISVRMPQCFVSEQDFEKHPDYYGYCPVKLGERVLVHPDGIIRICSLMIGTPYGVARFYDNKIVWDESPTNETLDHLLNIATPCTNQKKGGLFGEFAPLCVSFKPKQEELIWKEKIVWENKK